ncbi:MAG TPA: peptidoglycan editing factor PgeF [Nitrospirota bacterium]|nr:peptidoglycan editing factor PgeF [Nitrospirota bacterium]
MNTDKKQLYETITTKDICYLRIPDFERSGRIHHAITTRHNNLGRRNSWIKSPGDWHAVADAFGIVPDRIITVNQVHGETIARVDAQGWISGAVNINPRTVEADAIITNAPGIAIGVETADCVPVLLLDPEIPAVAAIHAGWRSTVRKIVDKTVVRMSEEFRSRPQRMLAAIGPAIGAECYEVDEPVMGPVREAFSHWEEITTPRSKGRWGLDLVKANARELLKMGLLEENVHTVGLCTACCKDLFYSFRAEGRTGRMLSIIMIRT